MASFNERYVVDKRGKRTGIILDIREYLRMLEDLEEIESIRAFDEAKASGEETIPFEQAIDEIERRSQRS